MLFISVLILYPIPKDVIRSNEKKETNGNIECPNQSSPPGSETVDSTSQGNSVIRRDFNITTVEYNSCQLTLLSRSVAD